MKIKDIYIHAIYTHTYVHKSIHTSTFARHCEKHLMVTMKYVHLHTYVRMYIQYIPLLRHTVGSTSSSYVSSAEPPTAKHRETQQMRQDTPVCRHGLFI